MKIACTSIVVRGYGTVVIDMLRDATSAVIICLAYGLPK